MREGRRPAQMLHTVGGQTEVVLSFYENGEMGQWEGKRREAFNALHRFPWE